MEYSLDMDRMISNFKNAKEPVTEDLFDTDGEEYIYNVLNQSYKNESFHIGDINLDSFELDDIITLIDAKASAVESKLSGVNYVIYAFMNSNPVISKERRFF